MIKRLLTKYSIYRACRSCRRFLAKTKDYKEKEFRIRDANDSDYDARLKGSCYIHLLCKDDVVQTEELFIGLPKVTSKTDLWLWELSLWMIGGGFKEK